MHYTSNAHGQGSIHEVLESVHIRPLEFSLRAPRPGTGRAVNDAIYPS